VGCRHREGRQHERWHRVARTSRDAWWPASSICRRFDLAIGAHEALVELELPGIGVLVLDRSGGVLATRASGRRAPWRRHNWMRRHAPGAGASGRPRWRHGRMLFVVVDIARQPGSRAQP
jgi:hypothetical protein